MTTGLRYSVSYYINIAFHQNKRAHCYGRIDRFRYMQKLQSFIPYRGQVATQSLAPCGQQLHASCAMAGDMSRASDGVRTVCITGRTTAHLGYV